MRDESLVGGETASVADDVEKDNQEIFDDQNYLTELVNENGSYKLFFGDGEQDFEEYEYSYVVPLINSDKPGAKEINDAIHSEFDEEIANLEKIRNKTSASAFDEDFVFPNWAAVNYKTFWNGSLLSLVIEKMSPYDDWTEYTVFNYDAKQGSQLSASEIVSRAGMDEDTLSADVKRGVLYYYDQMLSAFFEDHCKPGDGQDDQIVYVDYLKMRSENLKRDPKSSDNMYYLDEGQLKVYSTIDVPAGGGLINVSITPVKEDMKDFTKTYMDCVTITSANGEISICVNENDWSQETFGSSNIEFGKEYTVNGLYKNYKDCEILDLGNAHMPYPVLLCDDGTVAYIDMTECALTGDFYATEPMYGVQGVSEFAREDGAVAARLESGDMFNLQQNLDEIVNNRYPGFMKQLLSIYSLEGFELDKSADNGTIPQFYVGFHSEDESVFLFQDYVGEEHRREGRLNFIGMDEQGLIVSVVLSRDNDQDIPENMWKKGIWRIDREDYWDQAEEVSYSYLMITPLAGDDMFGNSMEAVKLTQCCG